MGKAIPIIATLAGAALTATGIGSGVGLGLLNAGIGLSAGVGIAIGSAASALAGFAVTTAINAIGNRAVSGKAKGAASTAQDARGQSVMIRSSIESHKIVYGQTRVSGPIVLAATTNTGPNSDGATVTADNLFLHLVIVLAAHEVQEIGTIYLNDVAVTVDANGFVQTSPYFKDGKSYVRVSKHLGTDNQAADSLLTAEYPTWTSAHRLQGRAYIYVRLQWNPDVYPNGTPNVSAVVKGKKVYDPRSATTVWTDNSALCTRDYMASDYGFNCDTDELNDDYWEAAANACDEAVTLSTGGTQDRYTTNGVIDTASSRIDNLNALVAAMAGAVTYVQGKFRGYAGTFDAPVGTIDLGMVVDGFEVVESPPRQDLFNRVQGTYVDPTKNWQPTDFPPVKNALYETQDGGEVIPKDVVLTLTNHPEAAQRIAKVLLEQGRQGIQLELKLMPKALSLAVWDTIALDNPALGWDGKVFRITNLKIDGIGPITVFLQEESSASYDWSNGEASSYDAAPDTNLPNPASVAPPSTLTVTEDLYVTRDGSGVKAKAILSWLPSPDAFVREYQAEYKLATDAEFTLLPRTTATTIDALDIAPGVYNFRVKAINTLGVPSTYAMATLQVSGLAAPPTEPQNLYWSASGGLAYLNWEPSPDLDVRNGGKYVIRYSPTPTDGWGSSTSIGNAVPGNSASAVLPLMPGVYLIKAEDTSSNQSENAASVVVTQDTIYALSIIATVTEDPTFSGPKTNCSVSGGTLVLTDTTLPGTYLFDSQMDLGSVQNVRLTAHMQVGIFNPSDLISLRTGLISSWENISGSESGAADAIVFVRTTQTDPAGSPTWTAWNRLHSGEFVARGFEFKVELMSYDPAYTIEISELNVKAAQ